jgi:hypothetical protein
MKANCKAIMNCARARFKHLLAYQALAGSGKRKHQMDHKLAKGYCIYNFVKDCLFRIRIIKREVFKEPEIVSSC